MITVYGTISNDAHVDTSKTLLGAKQYATRNGFEFVTKRIGYVSTIILKKVKKKWVEI